VVRRGPFSKHPIYVIVSLFGLTNFKGPERIKNLYAFRSLIDSGARVTFGSDFPVEPLNPLLGFYAAISRLTPSGDSPHGKGGWYDLNAFL
jgi:predicted amidohydrolase YtcJ